MGFLDKLFRIDARSFNKIQKRARGVFEYEEKMREMSDDELRGETPKFKKMLADNPELTIDDLLPEAYAACREAAKRVIGQFPYPVQVFGATVLNEGDVAEMKTGEGKTLTATMAVYLNALSGKGVHVVTVNEYLAQRDAEWMGQIYRFLGCSVGVNLREKDTKAKQEAYQCDITYTTNSEVGFDYLRDNMATSTDRRVLRNLSYAIVDEADSILIDESRTPLIISGGSGITANSYLTADRFVKALKKDVDFTIDIKKKLCNLTDSGVDKVQKAFGVTNMFDPQYSDLVHRIHQALKANFIMKKDVEYMVSGDEIFLIDSFTGRVLKGREYSDGLNQAIQAKEHVKVKPETITMATITYQNFFRLYDKLAGMTGTAKTEEEEFRDIYNMRVIVIPTNRPVIRFDDTDLVFGSEKAKYNALLKDVETRHAKGQPMLIGTPSVEKSEIVDALLTKANLPHEVLNAKNHEREAAIIAKAGEKGAITIATNMAGRGTDIKITDEVKKLGGLAVLGTERHEARRIDNQLRGRSGRQGDPGYSRFYVSIEDELMQRFASPSLFKMFDQMGDEPLESKTMTNLITSAQKKVEGQNFDTRKSLLDYDDVLSNQRKIMYKTRDKILYSPSIQDTIHGYFSKFTTASVNSHLKMAEGEKVVDGKALLDYLCPRYLPVDRIKVEDIDSMPPADIINFITTIFDHDYAKKRAQWSNELADYVEKTVVLQMTDRNWTRHIDTMSKLREAIYLRSYANTDPLQSYTNEGYDLFEKMLEQIASDITSALFRVQVQVQQPTAPSPAEAANQPEQAGPAPLPNKEEVGPNKPQEEEAPSYVKRPGEDKNQE
ncbi:MAG: preprotein translocase subunit SecA [Bacilli bacterium]|jgi:preprotein translocase subunit SecA|nr:preprotein translocase subunit SecA [Bacilli bacterium]